MKKEGRQQTPPEVAQQELFHRIKAAAGAAVAMDEHVLFNGPNCLEICQTFEISLPEAAQKAFADPTFFIYFNADAVCGFQVPDDLKTRMCSMIATGRY